MTPASQLLLLLLLLLLLPLQAQPILPLLHSRVYHPPTASVTLAWDLSSDVIIQGYNLYWGASSGLYTNHLDAGLTNQASVTWTNPPYGAAFYFAATAYDDAGLESPPSNEVSWNLPFPKTNVLLTVTGALELSDSVLGPWSPNFEDPFVRTNALGPLFFRSLIAPQITVAHF